MKVIAISGWKRSGKDTAANYIIDKHNGMRVAFADPLKDMVATEYGIPRDHCDNPEYKEQPILDMPVTPKDNFSLEVAKLMYKEFRTEGGHPVSDYHADVSGAFLGVSGRDVYQLYWTPRALCILKGSVNRAVRSDFWVQTAINQIENSQYKGNFVISDLRYRSELTQLKEAFGKNLITIRVNRFETCQSEDASERDLDLARFDVVLNNTGTLEEFYVKLDEVMNGIR